MRSGNGNAELPEIVSAQGDRLRDRSGREYIDLCMGYGSVWLGHNHPAVTQALITQLDGYSAPGYLPTAAQDAVHMAMAAFMPDTHFLGGLYSTGMEAVETALRAACVQTGRCDIAGFGAGVAQTILAWLEDGTLPPPQVHTPVRLIVRTSSTGAP